MRKYRFWFISMIAGLMAMLSMSFSSSNKLNYSWLSEVNRRMRLDSRPTYFELLEEYQQLVRQLEGEERFLGMLFL